jgi:riboflavin kinase/FMN adenylyltransferase
VAKGYSSTLVTFEPHPKLVLKQNNGYRLKILTTIDEKIELLQALQLDRLVVITFTQNFAAKSSSDFVSDILFDKIGFKEIVIGHDHAFGRRREGNFQTLKALGAQLGFHVQDLAALTNENSVVSSTRIRKYLLDGKIGAANKALGRPYFFDGVVVRGDGRGKSLGFPTANIELSYEHKILPAYGVYAVNVYRGGDKLSGMMNIGIRPTFGGARCITEVHILDFDRDIYDERLRIDVVDRMRGEMKFASPDALITQLQVDKNACRARLNQNYSEDRKIT